MREKDTYYYVLPKTTRGDGNDATPTPEHVQI